MSYIGYFKWYDDSKGFGVISTLIPQKKGTAEVFFHHSCWCDAKTFTEDKPILFEAQKRTNKNGFEATNCRYFDSSTESWQILFNNKEYNLYVPTKHYKINLMQECISMISTAEDTHNFILIFNEWHKNHPISTFNDIYDYIEGGAKVQEANFQNFIKNKIGDRLSFDDKESFFKNHQIGIYVFNEDECMQLLEIIDKNRYSTIKNSNTDLYLKIIKEKILALSHAFSFSVSDRYSYYRDDNTEYKRLSELLSDYIDSANEIQKKELIGEVSSILLDKEDVFINKVNSLLSSNASYIADKLKELTSFPDCLSDSVSSHFIELYERTIKCNNNLDQNIELMSLNALPIDTEYIEQHFDFINSDNIQLITNCDSGFSLSFIRDTLLKYLEKTKDIDSVIKCYKDRPDIQDLELTETIKSYINTNYHRPEVRFLYNATDYIPILGEDYVLTITTDYLMGTHRSEALIEQLFRAPDDYKEKLSSLLFLFHNKHRSSIDDGFVEPFCKRRLLDSHPLLTKDYIINIIEAYIDNIQNYKKALSLAKETDSEVKAQIESYLTAKLSVIEYMHLWEDGNCDNLPDGYLNSYFDDNEYKYSRIDKWIADKRVSKDGIISAMRETLERICGSNYYKHFRTEFLIYSYLNTKQWDNSITSTIEESRIKLFNWALNPSFTDFKSICETFILFPESIQVKIFKFIFLCIAQGKLQLSTDDLTKLNECNPKYLAHSEKDVPVMSLSTSVIIESLYSYSKNTKFITDKDFYKLVYKSVANGNNSISPIGSFFDKCTGKKKRILPGPYNITDFIYSVIGNDNTSRWYIINFDYDADLVNHVKAISGRRYHPQYKVWFVPESSISEIEQFAKNNKFVFIRKDFTPKDIGKPLSSLISYDSPEYKEAARFLSRLQDWDDECMPEITWCEGRESQNNREPDVWWCVGHNPCNACAIRLHSIDEWQNYTLYDFCNILGFNIAETNKYGHFSSGAYALYVTSINRFNKLLERLYCRECGKIIYPVESNYSAVGATSFHCTNPNCERYEQKIYLNHCYTRACRGIIDSRDEAKCPNGLVICSNCGTCCTTYLFEQRLLKLQNVGSKYIPPDLIHKIQNDEGHINHKDKSKLDIFFCHKCGAQLSGKPTNTVCGNCGTKIEYKTSLISRQ